eukprot:scaffold625_cov324-Pavlova_lutheri.AAC.16
MVPPFPRRPSDETPREMTKPVEDAGSGVSSLRVSNRAWVPPRTWVAFQLGARLSPSPKAEGNDRG